MRRTPCEMGGTIKYDRELTHLFNPRIIYYTTYFSEVKGSKEKFLEVFRSKGKFSIKCLHNANNIEILLIIIL